MPTAWGHDTRFSWSGVRPALVVCHAIDVIVPELANLTKAYIPEGPTMSEEEFYAKCYAG